MLPRETVAAFGESFTRIRVLLGPDYLERSELDGSSLSRRRVFFDEVQLLSLHRERRWGLAVSGLVVALAFALLALAIPQAEPAARWILAGFAGSALAIAALGWALPRQVVTVQGVRGRVRVAYFSGRRAEELFQRLQGLIRTAQTRETPPLEQLPSALVAPPAAVGD